MTHSYFSTKTSDHTILVGGKICVWMLLAELSTEISKCFKQRAHSRTAITVSLGTFLLFTSQLAGQTVNPRLLVRRVSLQSSPVDSSQKIACFSGG